MGEFLQISDNGDHKSGSESTILRLTAIWSFSEAFLGGILHALKLPVTGIVIGGFAALMISLIGYNTRRKRDILDATLQVILIKFTISPHSSLTSYFAIFVQGIFGFLVFTFIHKEKFAAFLISVFALFYSAVQKLIVMTILFGIGFWEAFNRFGEYVANDTFMSSIYKGEIKFSYLVIGVYLVFHLVAGIFLGILAIRLPVLIARKREELKDTLSTISRNTAPEQPELPKRRSKLRKFLPHLLAICFFSLTMVLPQAGEGNLSQLLLLIVRVISILIIWFLVFKPLAGWLISKILRKKAGEGNRKVETIIKSFPSFKRLFFRSIQLSAKQISLRGIADIIVIFLTLALYSEDE